MCFIYFLHLSLDLPICYEIDIMLNRQWQIKKYLPHDVRKEEK